MSGMADLRMSTTTFAWICACNLRPMMIPMAPMPRKRSWMGIIVLVCSIFLLLCSGLFSAVASASKKPTSGSTNQKRLEHLAARGPVVTLSDGNFTRYAEGKTRSYHLILLFTAVVPRYNCAVCRLVEIPFVKVAKAYAEQHDIRTDDHPIVFARVDIDDSKTTFGKYSVATAPHVYLIPMGKTVPTTSYALNQLEITKGLIKPGGDVEEFSDDIAKATGIKVVILPDTSGLLEGALLVGVALGVLGHFFAGVPSRVLSFVRSKGLWFIVSMACYLTGVGGMIFCIIRNPKTHGFDQRTGETAMFSSGGRDQFWFEGVVVALLYVGMSLAILGVYTLAGWKRVPSIARDVAVVACVTLLCYLSGEYLKLYMGKTMWYKLPQMLPSALGELYAEPLKRKHGLFKRLVRLTHLWLNEYTTWEAFRGKLKTFLWDYLVRKLQNF